MKKCSGLGMLELMITIAVAGIALVPLIGIVADISSENTLSREELLAVHHADTVFQLINCLPFDALKTGSFKINNANSRKDLSGRRSDSLEALLVKGAGLDFSMRVEIEKFEEKAFFTVLLDASDNPGLKRPVQIEGTVFRAPDFFERSGI